MIFRNTVLVLLIILLFITPALGIVSIDSRPALITNSTSATFTFNSTEQDTFECQLDTDGYSPCTSPIEYTDRTEGPHTFYVKAIGGGNNTDPSPASYTWTIDVAAPDTTITSTPPAVSNSASATFTFNSTEQGTFECQLDTGGYSPCNTTIVYKKLADGSHIFSVLAIDRAGNTDPSPAFYTWTVNIAPDTTITSTLAVSNSASAAFTFSSTKPGSFECKLDDSKYDPCITPKNYTNLTEGLHTFYVQAIEGVNNTDPSPASYTWTVDTAAPETTITSTPAASNSASATFAFTSSESGTFECKLDESIYDSCKTPKNYTGLKDDNHTFYVRAIDGAGNTDPSPASFEWIVDTTPPDQVTGLKSDIPTLTTVNLSWNLTVNTSHYRIYRNSTLIGNTQNTYWNETGLESGTFYQYMIRANDSYNNWGKNSTPLGVTTEFSTTAPIVITITSPEDKSVNITGFINVTIILNRPGNATLEWEGSNESMVGERTYFYKNMNGLLSGNYSYRVFANVPNGVFNTSETRIVMVNRTINDDRIGKLINKSTFIVDTTLEIASPSTNTTLIIPNGTNASARGAPLMSISIDSVGKMNSTFLAGLTNSDKFIGENVTLGPSGAVFNPPIRIRFNYSDAQIAGISESDLSAKYYNTTSNNFEPLTIFELNTTGNYLIVNINHFSTVALIGTAIAPPPVTSSGGGGSGGGGGGGGGSSGENYANIEMVEKYDLQISKDALTSYRFTAAKNPIMFVDITGNTSLGIITASAEVLKNTSSLVKLAPEWPVYKNVNIWVGTSGFATPRNIKQALIKFRVENSWIKSNNIKSSSIKMLRWDGSKWEQLETSEKNDDSKFTYYESRTIAFSSFAIVGEKQGSISENASLYGNAAIIESTKPAAVKQTEEKTSGFMVKWFLIIGVFFVIGIIIEMYIRKKKK